jgi:hypothetical protein
MSEPARPADPEPPRPRDLAVLLLASGDLLPRQRARDQQADLAGLALKKRVLEEVAALDPEPDELEAALLNIVEAMGPPTGPTRAVAVTFRDEWQAACTAPEWTEYLLSEAMRHSAEGDKRGRRVP